MYRSRIGLVVLMLLSAAARADSLQQIVDDAVAAPLREHRFSGVVLITKNGTALVRKAYGLADREAQVANTPATPFMIMSVSKQFTAALIMRLAAQGRLSLDDRVSDYVDDWPLQWDDVRIRHLLSHSAGTDIDTTYFWLIANHPEYWAGELSERPAYEPRALVTKPGETFLYSNIGYTILSRIATAAGGHPFDALMRDEVFCPLGMHNTRPERGEIVRGRARGYHRDGETLVRTEQGTVDIVGAGDLVSTADDLARWDDALYDDHFLPVSLRAAMHTTYLNGKLGEVGYGWFFRTTADGHRLQFHGGSGAGFRAWNYRVEDLRLSVVVLSNVDEADGTWVRAMVDRIVTEVAAR